MLLRCPEEAIRPIFVPRFQPGLCEPANRSGTGGWAKWDYRNSGGSHRNGCTESRTFRKAARARIPSGLGAGAPFLRDTIPSSSLPRPAKVGSPRAPWPVSSLTLYLLSVPRTDRLGCTEVTPRRLTEFRNRSEASPSLSAVRLGHVLMPAAAVSHCCRPFITLGATSSSLEPPCR